jgi:hypothetical protein
MYIHRDASFKLRFAESPLESKVFVPIIATALISFRRKKPGLGMAAAPFFCYRGFSGI